MRQAFFFSVDTAFHTGRSSRLCVKKLCIRSQAILREAISSYVVVKLPLPFVPRNDHGWRGSLIVPVISSSVRNPYDSVLFITISGNEGIHQPEIHVRSIVSSQGFLVTSVASPPTEPGTLLPPLLEMTRRRSHHLPATEISNTPCPYNINQWLCE